MSASPQSPAQDAAAAGTVDTGGAARISDPPLFDPDRDLIIVPHGGGGGGVDRQLRAAFEAVRAQLVAERVRAGSPATGPDPARFPAAPAVTALHPQAEPRLRQRVHTIVQCLQHLVRCYPVEPELRAFLDVPPVLDQWILQHPQPQELTVDYCRLDLHGDTLNTARVLEFNPSSPSGGVFFGMLNRFWRRSPLSPVLEEWQIPPAPFEHPHWFASWLLAYARAHGLVDHETRRVGIFHPPHTKLELDHISMQLRRLNRLPLDMDPSDLDAGTGDGDGQPLRLGYFKYVFKHVSTHPSKVTYWDTFCSRLTTGELLVPNPLAERWVAENKLCLAALSDDRFRHLFTPAQRQALDALVPFSRKLGDGVSTAQAISERNHLVLKAPYSCQGQDVVIGAATEPDDWRRLVQDSGHRGWLVQERVRPQTITTSDGGTFRDLVVPVLDGRVIGYGARRTGEHLLNYARGAACQSVFSPHALDHPSVGAHDYPPNVHAEHPLAT
jgi:hypothetical protein